MASRAVSSATKKPRFTLMDDEVLLLEPGQGLPQLREADLELLRDGGKRNAVSGLELVPDDEFAELPIDALA